MRNFKKDGVCTTEELLQIIRDLSDCVIIANKTKDASDLQNTITIRKLIFDYQDGQYYSEIEYNIGLKEQTDDNEKRTFREST